MRKDRSMIGLTRTNGDHCRLHPAEIQRVETHPCTLVYLTDGTKYAVVEEIDEIARRVRDSRARGMAAVYRIVDPPAVPSTSAGHVVPADVLPADVVPLRSRRES
jgi:flagellar protein FlbD